MAWKKLDEEEMNQSSGDAELWVPEPGNTLQGNVKLVHQGKHKLFMIIEETDEDFNPTGNEWMTKQCFSLENQIKKLGIEKGDIVHLSYHGRDAEQDYEPHIYVVQKWEDD